MSQTMIDVERALPSVLDILNRHVRDEERKAVLEGMAGLIGQRLGDELLNLAVIGQFSSGKTTLINALLRRRILKVMNQANTAAAAYITEGSPFAIRAVFRNGASVRASETDMDALRDHLARYQRAVPADLVASIELLTNDEAVSNDLASLEISFPSENPFFEGMRVIDTPGLFAGADYATSHAAITQSIIDDKADLVVVLMPCHQAMSAALLDFLAALKPYLLQQCVFIITEMDRVESASERQEIIDYARALLQERLKLDDPLLYHCCAISVLPEGAAIASVSRALEYWQSEFSLLETRLGGLLAENKEAIIAGRLKFLMHDLLEEMDKELGKEKDSLSKEEALLDSTRVKAMDEALGRMMNMASKRIEEKGAEILEEIDDCDSQIEHIQAEASRRVDSAGSDIYKTYKAIESALGYSIGEQLKQMVANVNMRVTALQQLCREASKEFEKELNKNYATFRFLDRQIKVDPVTIRPAEMPQYHFSAFRSDIETQLEEGNAGRNKGALFGGAVGMVAGPVGAAIFGWLGSRIGKYVARDSLDILQPKLKRTLHDEIESAFKKGVRTLRSKVAGEIAGAKQGYQALCDDHRKTYGKDVKKLIDQHQAQQQALLERIIANDKDKQTLSIILNILKQ